MTENFMEEEDHSEDFEKIEKSATYKKIKKSLLDQMKENEIAKEVFEDLVKDYMKLYVVKELLITDIRKTGVSISYRNRNGYTTAKRNTSVSDFYKVNQQMITLLNKLKLSPVIEEENTEEDDDDEL